MNQVGMTAPASETRSYRLRPEAFEAVIKRRIYGRVAWSYALILVMVAAALAVMSRVQPNIADGLPISIPIVLVALTSGGFLAVRAQVQRERSAWASYQLTIDANLLRRLVGNVPPMEITRAEVTRILAFEDKGLRVETADRHKFIFIPEQLVEFEDVRRQLASWLEPELPRLARNRALGIGVAVLLSGSWIACGVIPDLGIAMIPGAVVVVVGAWAMRETLKSRVADRKQKARIVGLFALMMFAPFGRLLLALMYSAMSRP
jgi:hypothetical protein